MKWICAVLVIACAVGIWWAAVPAAQDPASQSAPRTEEAFARMPIGKPAPDFELKQIPSGRPIRLAELQGRPTVLAFGSFSCDLFCSQLSALVRLHREHRDQVNFALVYIREAGHANAELDEHLKRNPAKPDRITAGLELYSIGFTCLDGRDSEVVREYHCWPERLYLLDSAGTVVWESGVGIADQGLRLGEASERLRELLGRN